MIARMRRVCVCVCVYRFCPSVFFYLLCLVPTIWFLELNELENRIGLRPSLSNDTTVAGSRDDAAVTTAETHVTYEFEEDFYRDEADISEKFKVRSNGRCHTTNCSY